MNIAVLPGDGIGKEVTAQAVRVLKAVVGGAATFTKRDRRRGVTGAACRCRRDLRAGQQADAILFGAVGLAGDELGRATCAGPRMLTLRARSSSTQFSSRLPFPGPGRRVLAKRRVEAGPLIRAS